MDITIVIPFCDGHSALKSLLNSIPPEFPVIVVDDHSDQPPKCDRANTLAVRIPKKGYFSGAVNYGIKQCKSDVLILNQDVQFHSRKAFDLVLANREKYAIIGESISGTHPAWPEKYVHGTFMFIRRDAIKTVGLLNEEHYPLWGSTCEWQLRACRKGYKALPTKIPGMTHKRKGNYGSAIEKLLKEKHNERGKFIRTPPLISVIVPAYNHARFLPELINSLIGGSTSLGVLPAQTFQSFEVIIVDDCSTDNTQEVMQELADPWKAIKYLRTPTNSGTSVACNLAIQSSFGKYIARIDADDMREAGSLEAMLKVQLENPKSFVYDDVQLFTPKGLAKGWKIPEYDFDALINKNFIPAGIMFPKEAWEEVGGYPEEMRHGRDDWAFNVGLGVIGWCGIRADYVGYMYRRHGENRTITNTTPAHRAAFKQQIMSLYPEAYAEERPMGCCGPRTRIQSQTTQVGGAIMAAGMPGTDGLVLIQYLGANSGNQDFYGPATGSVYTFSARKNKRWVDPRDLHFELRSGEPVGLLDLFDKTKPIFKPFREPIAEKVAEATVIAEKEAVLQSDHPAPNLERAIIDEEIAELEVSESVDDTTEMIVDVPDDYFVFIKGIGKATSAKMVAAGYLSSDQVRNADDEDLKEEFNWSDSKVASIREQLEDAS